MKCPACEHPVPWWRRLLGIRTHADDCPIFDVAPNGKVRGWHSGCPAASPGSLGTYELVIGEDGTVDCAACGAKDLGRG